MHEVTAHPDAPDMIRLFAPHLGPNYDPFLTPGTLLAAREDWVEIVAAAKESGARSARRAGCLTVRRPTTYATGLAGELEVCRGEPAHARDGEIGQIQGLVIDPGRSHVTDICLEEGHLWGCRDVAIEIRAVTWVGDIVRLTISMQQVRDLPRWTSGTRRNKGRPLRRT